MKNNLDAYVEEKGLEFRKLLESAHVNIYEEGVPLFKWLRSTLTSTIERTRETLDEYIQHKPECIRSRFSEGRPTEDGGYEQKFGGKWYEVKPIDKSPVCDCGLDTAIATLKQETR